MQKMAWCFRLFHRSSILGIFFIIGLAQSIDARKKTPPPPQQHNITKNNTPIKHNDTAPSSSTLSIITSIEKESINQGKKILELENTITDLTQELAIIKRDLAQLQLCPSTSKKTETLALAQKTKNAPRKKPANARKKG